MKRHVHASNDELFAAADFYAKLREDLESNFEDNIISRYSSYIDENCTESDAKLALKKYESAKMQYLTAVARLIKNGNYIE